MKVLHLVAGDLNGGAARGAYWLHLGLKELGVDSKILTNSKITFGDDSVVTILVSKKAKLFNMIRNQLDNICTIFYSKRKRIIFSTGFFGVDFTKTKEYKEADIIHLHWINGGFVNIKHLSKVQKPVVWTMRDMWPMTGGCHYTMGCDRYKIGCGRCPMLQSNCEYDLSRHVINRKKRHLPKNIVLVGISKWLSDLCRESHLFRGFDIRTIYNNINTSEFFPIDKNVARDILGLKTKKKIILAGSWNIGDFYKGIDKFIDAIKLLDKNKYVICFFGNIENNLMNSLDFEYKSFGYLNDNISLRLVYSAADVFVAPSLMDAFGKTLAEAMACGTPVVCFDATGPKEIVDHMINGYKAKPFDPIDLANGIDWILNLNSDEYAKLSENARKKVLKEFDSQVVAKKYIELYKEILGSKF